MSKDKREVNGPDAGPVRVLTDRERFDKAIEQIKAKHIDQYRSVSGYLKRTAWRTGISYGHLNKCISGGGIPSKVTMDRILDFAALDHPFSYDQFAHWEPIATLPRGITKVIFLRDKEGDTTEVHFSDPHFRNIHPPYQIIDASKYLCWRFRDVQPQEKK